MVSTMVSSSRRRSSTARLAAVSCACALSANLRLASRSAAMWLKERTKSSISPVVTEATRCSYLPAAISSMASASASTGRVICLERNSASHTLKKKSKTVMSRRKRKKTVRIRLRERKSCQKSAVPELMLMAVRLKPSGKGRATTTTLPDAVADMPSAELWPATLRDRSSPRCAAASNKAESGPRSGTGRGARRIEPGEGWPERSTKAPENWRARVDSGRRLRQSRRQRNAMRTQLRLELRPGPGREPRSCNRLCLNARVLGDVLRHSAHHAGLSLRNCSALGENQRSRERFISR